MTSIQDVNEELLLSSADFNIASAIIEINKEANVCANKLHLSGFHGRAVETIIRALPCSSSLESFTISYCSACLDAAQVIANLIKGSKLQKIEILNCIMGSDALLAIANCISSSLCSTLNFRRITIQKDTAKKIANLLDQHCLIKLTLSECKIQNDDWCSILEAIKKSTLQTLILNDIAFNYSESNAVIDCVENAQLTKLSLRRASFSKDKLIALMEALKQSSLKTLDMRDMHIDRRFNEVNNIILHSSIVKFNFDKAIFSFNENILFIDSTAIRRSSEHISFRSVYFDNRILTKVCDLLEDSCLTSLDLVNCSLSKPALERIVVSIKKSSITSLNWGESDASIGITRIICDLLENHHLLKLRLVRFSLTNEIMKALLASIKKSSVVKFNVDVLASGDKGVLDEIKQATKENQQRLNSSYKIKSARSLY